MDKEHVQGTAHAAGNQGLSSRTLELARRIDTLPQSAQDHIERMVESIAGLVSDDHPPRPRGRRRRSG